MGRALACWQSVRGEESESLLEDDKVYLFYYRWEARDLSGNKASFTRIRCVPQGTPGYQSAPVYPPVTQPDYQPVPAPAYPDQPAPPPPVYPQ